MRMTILMIVAVLPALAGPSVKFYEKGTPQVGVAKDITRQSQGKHYGNGKPGKPPRDDGGIANHGAGHYGRLRSTVR